MNEHSFAKLSVALVFLAASTSIAWSEDGRENARWEPFHNPASIEGVWRVTRHGVNCVTGGIVSTFPALMTFHADGTVSGQAVPPGTTSAFGPSEFGVWHRKERGPGFSFRLLTYNYSDTGVMTGSTEVTGAADLTGANTFTYKASVAFFDATGGPLFTGCGQATGVRF
jgi:hypothetical protein